MASASSSLIKGVLVLLFIAAVFVGLNFMLEQSPDEPAPPVQTPTAAPATEDPAVAEAREIGRKIGRQVGEEIGRRVGENLVARLEDEGFPETAPEEEIPEEETQVAEAAPEESPRAQETLQPEAAPEPAEPEEVAEPEEIDEPEVALDDEESAETPEGSETRVADAGTAAEQEASGVSPAKQPAEPEEREYPVVEQTAPGIPIETVHSKPDSAEDDPKAMIPNPAPRQQAAAAQPVPAPQKSSGATPQRYPNWWTASVNGKGLRIVHVGQSVSADGQKGISIIASDALAQGQNIENLVQVHDGAQVLSDSWRIAPHRKSLFLHVAKPGTYQVSFDPALEAANGRTLGMELSGPVTIR